MTGLMLPPIEQLDVDDLASLPEGYRYELHGGNLVITTPSSYWHKVIARRLLLMLPRDNRLPDLGVVTHLPPGLAAYSNLPGPRSASSSRSSRSTPGTVNTDKAVWYAQRGIPEYWIVEQTPERSDDDALVLIHRLTLSGGRPAYVREQTQVLSALEAEYAAKAGTG